MDVGTSMDAVSWVAVAGATLSAFLVGGLWYGPLFGRAWAAHGGHTEADLRQRNMARVFGGAVALSAVAAFVLALFVGPDGTWSVGLAAGLAAGLGWVAPMLGILALFEGRGWAPWLIDAGYCVVALAVMGTILGAL